MHSLAPKNWFQNNIEIQIRHVSPPSILEDKKSQVHLVCQALQIALLEDANMDASHLSADIELDGR